MRNKKPTGRARLTRVLALLCCLSVTVSTFAFFTDRTTHTTEAVAGDIDLIFNDISSSKTGSNGIQSPNEFAQDYTWKNGIISPGGITNPGDYFDLSFELLNTGTKSMDVRHRLILTSSLPLTAGEEEYQLTVLVGDNPTPVPGVLSGEGMVITYDLPDALLNGSVELEPDATADPRYIVRLDFLLEAGNEFMDSDVTVYYNAQAKQHRYTDSSHWAPWAEYETSFDQVGTGEPIAVSLSGNGQIFYKAAPAALSFHSSSGLEDLQAVKVDGVVLDPSNYTLTGDDSDTITLSVDYLQTLDPGAHKITAAFEAVAPTAIFYVVDGAEPGDLTLTGDGQIFNKLNPKALTFVSSGKQKDFRSVQVDGEILDPSSYTVTGEDNTEITLSVDYLQTLDLYNHEIHVVSATGAPSASFTVVEFTQAHNGLYYDVYYSFTEPSNPDAYIGFVFREDGTAYMAAVGASNNSDDTGLTMLAPSAFSFDGDTIMIEDAPATVSADGTSITLLVPPDDEMTFTLDPFAIFFDEDIAYAYVPSFGGYMLRPIDNTKSRYETIRSEVYGYPVVGVSDSAFQDNTSLTSIELPDSVVFIGDSAFRACTNLESIDLGGTETTGLYSFYNCTSLTSVDFGTNMKVVGSSSFQGCTALTSITLPVGLETIDDYAFLACSNLSEAVIPSTVTLIGERAFAGCPLNKVYYMGTEDEWDAIEIEGTIDNPLLDATIHYNYAG